MKSKKATTKQSRDFRLAMGLLAPSIILLLLLVAYPMISNVVTSFFKMPRNPKLASEFLGFTNYIEVLSDPNFYTSLGVTLVYTALTVIGSTVLGLMVALFFNREFRGRSLVRSLIILSYVAPSISLVFTWKYMFNQSYGIMNFLGGDILRLFDEAPLWFDNPVTAFILVVIFAIWRFFPYAFISFLAILQTLDKTLYEAARIDGANIWQQFKAVTLPAIMPVLAVVVTLRMIWMFYMYADVWLLTQKVNIIGVYLYQTAFAMNDLGKAAAISIILFAIIFIFIFLIRKRVNLTDEK